VFDIYGGVGGDGGEKSKSLAFCFVFKMFFSRAWGR
jgi:hypothetical protein